MGTSVTGWLSDHFARQALLQDGVSQTQALAIGLRDALFEVPILALVLSVVLLAAARMLAAQIRVNAPIVEPKTELT
jgi:hypothetical protein